MVPVLLVEVFRDSIRHGEPEREQRDIARLCCRKIPIGGRIVNESRPKGLAFHGLVS